MYVFFLCEKEGVGEKKSFIIICIYMTHFHEPTHCVRNFKCAAYKKNVEFLTVPGAPRCDSGVWCQDQDQPVHTGSHVSVQHYLLSGRSVLLLCCSWGEEHQEHPEKVNDQPEKSNFQHFRGLNCGQLLVIQSVFFRFCSDSKDWQIYDGVQRQEV